MIMIIVMIVRILMTVIMVHKTTIHKVSSDNTHKDINTKNEQQTQRGFQSASESLEKHLL